MKFKLREGKFKDALINALEEYEKLPDWLKRENKNEKL